MLPLPSLKNTSCLKVTKSDANLLSYSGPLMPNLQPFDTYCVALGAPADSLYLVREKYIT